MQAAAKATRIQFLNFTLPQMRAFHMTWVAFFLCFVGWFAIAPLSAVIQKDLKLTDAKAPGFDISTGSGDINFRLANIQPVTNEKHALKTGGSPVLNIRTGSGDVTVE